MTKFVLWDREYALSHKRELIINFILFAILVLAFQNAVVTFAQLSSMYPAIIDVALEVDSAPGEPLNTTQVEILMKANFLVDVLLAGMFALAIVSLIFLGAAVHFASEVLRIIVGERTTAEQIVELRKEVKEMKSWRQKSSK